MNIWNYLCSISYWGFELSDILAIIVGVGSVVGLIIGLHKLNKKYNKGAE